MPPIEIWLQRQFHGDPDHDQQNRGFSKSYRHFLLEEILAAMQSHLEEALGVELDGEYDGEEGTQAGEELV